MLSRVRVFSLFISLLVFGFTCPMVVAQVLGTPPPAPANGTTTPPAPITTTGTAQLIEWDLSAMYKGGVDAQPGAVGVDKNGSNSSLWFVTRAADFRVIRLRPAKATKTGMAQWSSWQLDSSGVVTGGIKRLKASDDGRIVFVRTLTSIQRVDTGSCSTDAVTGAVGCDRIIYDDSTCVPDASTPGGQVCTPNAAMISDLTLDGKSNVYTAISANPSDPVNSYIQKLEPTPFFDINSPTNYSAKVTRWQVGGGAGNCIGGHNNPCLAGIAVHPKNSSVIYYSEPDDNNIGELNTATCTVRRWSLTTAFPSDSNGPGVTQPRQLNIDRDGIVWVVTGSGDLISLDPKKNLVTRHQIPGAALNDPFGVAPSEGFVGYTASEANKVAMLVPKGKPVYICPTSNPVLGRTVTKIPVTRDRALTDCGQVPPNSKAVTAIITGKADGTFVEALIDSNAAPNGPSTLPLGITPHPSKAIGTFFYAVGMAGGGTIDRVGIARLPRAKLKAKHEREDKDCDDDGSNRDDEDHDGIPDRHKTNDSSAEMNRQNDQLAPGQSSDYVLTAGPNTNALVAVINADDPLAPVSVEIMDPNGLSVALPVATPGVAVATIVPTTTGDYTVRVKNHGLSTVTHETQLITRAPLSLPVSLP